MMVATIIVFFCVQPSIREFAGDENDEADDDVKTPRRQLDHTLPSSPVFTEEPFLVAGPYDVKTDEPIGVFLYYTDDSQIKIPYNTEFKKYASLEYVEKNTNGNIISSGELTDCD